MNTKLLSFVIWGLFLVIRVDITRCDDSTSRAINLSMAWRPVHYTPVQAIQPQVVHKPQATQFISIPTLAKANTAQLLQIAHYNAQLLNAKMKDLQTQYSNQYSNQYRSPYSIFGANTSSPKFRAALLNELKPFSPKYTVTASGGLTPVNQNGYINKPVFLSEIDHHLPLVHSSTPKIPSVVPSVSMSPTITHYSYIPLLSASPSSLIFRDTPVVMPAAQSATFQGKTTLKPHPVLNKLQAHLALATNHKQPYASYSNILEKLTVPVLTPNGYKNHFMATHFIKQSKNIPPVSKIINNTVPKRVTQVNEQPRPTPSEVSPQKSVESGVRSRENRTRITIFEDGPFTPIVRENAVVKEAKPTLKSTDVLNELNRHRNIIQIMEGLPQIPSSVSSVDISGEQNFRPIEILKKYNISKSPLQDLTRYSFQPSSFMDFTSPSRKYPLLPTVPTTMMTTGDRLSSSHFRFNEIKETPGTAFTFLPTPNSYGHHHRKPQFSGSHTFFTIEDAVTGTTPTRNSIDFKDLFDTTTEIIKPVVEEMHDVTTTAPEPHTHFYKFMKYPSSSSTITIFETTTPRSKLKHRRRKPGHRYKSNINDPNWIDKLPKESTKESIKVEKNVTTESSDITTTTRLSARFRQRPKTETTTTTTESIDIPTTPVTEISDQVAPTTLRTTTDDVNSTTTTVSTTSVVAQNISTLKPMAKYNSISRPRLSLKNSSYYLNNLSTTTNQPSEIVTTPKFTRKRLPTRPSTTTTEASEDKTSSTESSTTTSTSKRFHPTRNNTFTRLSFTKPTTEGSVSRGSATPYSTRRGGSSRVDFRNQKSTTTSSTTDQESSTRSSTLSHRRFQSAQDKLDKAKQRQRVEETSSPESTKVDTTTEHKLETSIMKIAKNDHSYRPYAHQTSKTTESLLNSNLINEISTEKSAKSVNSNAKNRRIPEYFTIATDDPILPIQAFFPKFD